MRPSLTGKAAVAFKSPIGAVRLSPPLAEPNKSRPVYLEYVRQLASVVHSSSLSDRTDAIGRLRDNLESAKVTWPASDMQMLHAAALTVTDLALQGWKILAQDGNVLAEPPAWRLADPLAEKERIRAQELIKRSEQLSQPAVRAFIRGMERKRLHEGRFVSIFSLMRDGRELAHAIGQARSAGGEAGEGALKSVVDPYLQFVTENSKCSWTGLRLQDIWRYFRHTWVNQYVSVPGRIMMFLVRDRAADFHPVLGIGALSSTVVQIRERDGWIGWLPETFLEELAANGPSDRIARWLQEVVDAAIAEVYVADFLGEELLTPSLMRRPTLAVIQHLVKDSKNQREEHHRFPSPEDHKGRERDDLEAEEYWERRARSHLFRSKRALALGQLLWTRMVLSRHFDDRPTAEGLASLLSEPAGQRVIRRIVRKAKADRVGIVAADLSVCGAVPPYNALLGGKLVAMVATSPEVVRAYRERYGGAVSEIASATAGRPVVRPPDLVFVGTTSLYGGGPTQYDGVTIPCERLGGRPGEVIRYRERKRSGGFGTSQFSAATVNALQKLTSQSTTGQRVNSIFGEGVSPKLRKIRDGLEQLRFPADKLLQHGRRRTVYCVTLIRNTRDFMLGLTNEAEYLAPLADVEAKTQAIVQWWRERWFAPRAKSQELLQQIGKHTLVYPITHGARVVLPILPSDNDDQLSLFGK